MRRADPKLANSLKRYDKWKWLDEAAEAEASPGVWFEMIERSTHVSAENFAAAIKDGRKRAFGPAGTFDACVRNGVCVYIRYVGEGS